MVGNLKITFGCMFSGKTSKLINDIHIYLDIMKKLNIPCKSFIINHELDNRNLSHSGVLTTHSKCVKVPSDEIVMIKTSKLEDIYENVKDATYIGIDECQFFEDLFPFVLKLISEGKYIHCIGLISDTKMEKFGKLLDLFPYADDIEQVKAYCLDCMKSKLDLGSNASFTKWISNDDKLNDISVGDSNYAPCCRKHF
jgi:thymidine kinase